MLGDKMIVFGGFDHGVRLNTIIAFEFTTNTWEEIKVNGKTQPQSRAGHSAVIHENSMYIFGGKDEDNEKLNDLWCFDFTERTWK